MIASTDVSSVQVPDGLGTHLAGEQRVRGALSNTPPSGIDQTTVVQLAL
ncbi:hypothetical protein [Bradyrhizobium sp. 6(2017)]|nr:hypothetical protein [Bradyrhizobium sp. 6(2017)]QIG94185.1 hypothetical protein G6P99_18005 [Bradyrhizobium sp. 6(2017)]